MLAAPTAVSSRITRGFVPLDFPVCRTHRPDHPCSKSAPNDKPQAHHLRLAKDWDSCLYGLGS
jgi:hypothetical protein